MNVLILTEGGRGIGFGHVARCSALYEAFVEKGVTPHLIINGDATVTELVVGKRYTFLNWLGRWRTILQRITNADIVIIDSYLAKRELYHMISNEAALPVYIDDMRRIEYPRGIVLNGALGAEKMGYPCRKGVSFLTGSSYALLRKEFWKNRAQRIRTAIARILITCGGDDARNMTPRLLEMLSTIMMPLKKVVIVGKAYAHFDEIERLQDDSVDIVYYPRAAELKSVMVDADLAISAGGQTLSELACLGVPTIAIATADNQLYGIEQFCTAGFLVYAGWWESPRIISRVRSLLMRMKSTDVRRRCSVIGRSLVDGAGSRRVVRYLMAHQ